MSNDRTLSPSRYMKLNVGGELFFTTAATLMKNDSLLKIMMTDGQMETLKDSEGCIIIDRCGKHFGTILNFLRDGSVPLPDSYKDIAELLGEAQYYMVNELAELCQEILTKDKIRQKNELVSGIPVVTSSEIANILISASKMPVVKLLFNRHNNKYSYTFTSNDNLMKNLELFDKLSIKHSGRILFIKDIDERSQEICRWSFYDCNSYNATICCTDVLETDKKYTNVDFPEDRIVRETDTIIANKYGSNSAK